MRVVAVDIETTGLDPNMAQILQVAAVDDKGRVLNMYLKHDHIIGELEALVMNAVLLQKFKEGRVSYTSQRDVIPILDEFLGDNCIILGKDFDRFDRQFLLKLPQGERIKKRRRVVDVGSIYAAKYGKVHSLAELMELESGIHTWHEAVSDCEACLFLWNKACAFHKGDSNAG